MVSFIIECFFYIIDSIGKLYYIICRVVVKVEE